MSGVPSKPPSKRRRRNKPASYGLAEPVTASAADVEGPGGENSPGRTLDIENPHPLIKALWTSLQTSCESRFYSESDWRRVHLELWFANETMVRGPVSAAAWEQIQRGLNALLISPAEKRRCAIEVRLSGPDADENAAVALIGRYRQQLKPL
jgi:hypothetical protein